MYNSWEYKKRDKILTNLVVFRAIRFIHRSILTLDFTIHLISFQTISCVLMFAMERPEFPVDTHVWHITKKLGWVPPTCSRESCYEHLNNRVPDSLKFALHVLLVDHGKVCKACSKGGGGGKGKKIDEVQQPHP